MSTKSTIAYGDDFHLYKECFDDANIYLELTNNPEFEVTQEHVIVAIPLEIWEVVRQRSFIDLSLINKTDDEIRQMVEADIKERMDTIKEAEAKGQNPGILRACGLLVYGSADEPIQVQVEKGVEYYTKRRQFQKELTARIKTLEQGQRN